MEKIHRRKFLQAGALTLAGLPFSRFTANASGYRTSNNSIAAEALYEAFKNPTGTAKPFVRWWWNGLRVTKDELLRELDMLKQLGIGGVEINSIRFPETADATGYKEMEWLSNEWIELLQFVVQAARERKMICDIIMGSGWPFGGEFLTKDEQTQMMALGTRSIKGPQILTITQKELLDAVEPPIASKNAKKYKELRMLRLAPATIENLEQTISLDSETDKETITINVPAGDHLLYFLVKLTGFMAVMQGAPGASGPVLNHYNKAAVEGYINRMSDAIEPKMGKLGNSFRAVFTDSLELEGANWNDDMWEEFEKQHGYSLKPYLPFVLFKTGRLGRPIPEQNLATFSASLQDTIDRVRYDFETTKMALFQERFLAPLVAWCKKNGVLCRVQAYGREFHPSDSSMQLDLPDCETWMRTHIGEDPKEFDYSHGRAYSEVNKFISSGARLTGKKLISCEEITNTEMVFNETLQHVKITGDQSNLSGVTHSILHGFNYSPKEAPFPGWVRYGTFFNERNPWWPYLPAWVAYKARLSAIFQSGELVSDIAVMHPLADLWSKYAAQWDPFPERAHPVYVHNVWEAIHQNGNGCDYVSEYILQNASFPNGKLTYGPRQYKMLLMIEVETIHPKTATAISRFADAGGKIVFVGKQPWKTMGWKDHALGDKEVANTINSAVSKHPDNLVVYPAPDMKNDTMNSWYKGLMQRFNIQPYMKTDNSQITISQVYYKTKELDAFFISNYSATKGFELNAEFDVKGKTAWLWNPETGERFLYPTAGAANKLHISLGPAESKLIVFHKGDKGVMYMPMDIKSSSAKAVTGDWKVTLNRVDGQSKTITLTALKDFKDDDELKAFAGTAIYENSIRIDNPSNIQYLDLGRVEGVSEVKINGQKAGFRWYGHQVYRVGNSLQKGENKLVIKIATTLGNYMASLKENKDSIKWVINRKQPMYSVGLIGPVTLI